MPVLQASSRLRRRQTIEEYLAEIGDEFNELETLVVEATRPGGETAGAS